MKTIVIYHRADFDGIFCREIARKFLPEAELIGWDFGDDPVEPRAAKTQYYILDLPVDRVFGLEFPAGAAPETAAGFENVVWIDHHKSSIESHPRNIPGYRIDGVAACRLAWQWFNKGGAGYAVNLPTMRETYFERKVIEPLAVRLAGEYDIWDKRDERAELFQFGLRASAELLTPNTWENLLALNDWCNVSVELLLEKGRPIQRYQREMDAGVMHRSFTVEFEGLIFLALNTARCNSLTFAAKDIPETGHEGLLGFYWNGEVWTVSLYHAAHRKDIDLSTIAVKHGGGGHRGACGFRAAKLPFLW